MNLRENINYLLKEIKVNQPQKIPNEFSKWFNDMLVSWFKIHIEDYNEYSMNDIIENNIDFANFVRNDMISNNYEVIRKGEPYLITYDTKLYISDISEYVDDNDKIKQFLNNLVLEYYMSQIDFESIKSKLFKGYIKEYLPYHEEDEQDPDLVKGDMSFFIENHIEDLNEIEFIDDISYDPDFKEFLRKKLHTPSI